MFACIGVPATTKKSSRSQHQPQTVGEATCLLQPSSSSSMVSKTELAGRKSKHPLAAGGYVVDAGLAAATMPLLRDLRPSGSGARGYERPPSYETACSASTPLDRLMTGGAGGDQAVCTITGGGGSNPSAVAYHSYPAAAAGSLQAIPDPLCQNSAQMMSAGDWTRYSVMEDYCGGGGGAQQAASRTAAGTGKRNMNNVAPTLSPTHMQSVHQSAAKYQHNPQPSESHGLVAPWQHVAPQRRLHHYPTPPSQHGGAPTPYDLGGGTLGHPAAGGIVPALAHPEQFLTPSPDSPGQWSSSSPHSGHSDWSEGISSPPQSLTHTQHHHHQHQTSLPAAPSQRLTAPRSVDTIFLVRT